MGLAAGPSSTRSILEQTLAVKHEARTLPEFPGKDKKIPRGLRNLAFLLLTPAERLLHLLGMNNVILTRKLTATRKDKTLRTGAVCARGTATL